MATLQNAPSKQRGLFALAIILLVLGGVFIFIGSHNFAIRTVGLAFVLASTYLIQASKVRDRLALPEARGEVNNPKVTGVQGRLLWIVSVSLVPALAGAWYLLDLDAANGGQAAWPVYVFTGVGLICAVVWSLFAVRILGWRGRR
jgi:hypothetical protein